MNATGVPSGTNYSGVPRGTTYMGVSSGTNYQCAHNNPDIDSEDEDRFPNPYD